MVTDFIFDPEAVKENGEKTIKETEDALKELENKRAGYEIQIRDIDKKAADERKAIAQEAADKLKKQQEEEAAAKRLLRENELKLIKNDRDRELKENEFKYEKLIEDLKKGKKELNDTDRALIATYEAQRLQAEQDINNKYDKIQKDHDAKVLSDMQAADKAQLDAFYLGEQIKIDAMQEGYAKQEAIRMLAFNKEAADLQAKLDAGLISQEQYNQANVSLSAKLNDDLQKLRDEDNDKEKARHKARQDFIIEQSTQAFSLIQDFAQQVQDKFRSLNQAVLDNENMTLAEKQKMIQKNNAQAKKAFNAQKAAQIASAVMTTYQSATAAYASQFVPVPDPSSPVRGTIAAGLAVGAGLANVAKIAKQKFEGTAVPTGGGGSEGGGGSGAGGGGAMAPDFNVVGNNNINQLAQLQQQPIKAYVVGAEVTTQQALDRNRIATGQL